MIPNSAHYKNPRSGIRAVTTRPDAMLRTDLNGSRLTPSSASGAIFVVLWGRACRVPDYATYTNLWDETTGIVLTPELPNIASGNPLSPGAYLATNTSGDALFLVTNGFRYGIPSSALADSYKFSVAGQCVLADAALNAIPRGPDLTGPR